MPHTKTEIVRQFHLDKVYFETWIKNGFIDPPKHKSRENKKHNDIYEDDEALTAVSQYIKEIDKRVAGLRLLRDRAHQQFEKGL